MFLVDKKLPHWWLNKNIRKSIIQEYEPLVGEDIYSNDISDLAPRSLYNLVYYRVHLHHPKVVLYAAIFGCGYVRHHLIQLIDQLRKKHHRHYLSSQSF